MNAVDFLDAVNVIDRVAGVVSALRQGQIGKQVRVCHSTEKADPGARQMNDYADSRAACDAARTRDLRGHGTGDDAMLVPVLLLSAALPLAILLFIGILAHRDRQRNLSRPVVVVMRMRPRRLPVSVRQPKKLSSSMIDGDLSFDGEVTP